MRPSTGEHQGPFLVVVGERQDDHEVEGGQQTTRREIVDWRDPASRHVGAQPGTKDEVEGPPIDQHHQKLLAEPAMHPVRIADLAYHQTTGHPQGRQGKRIEERCPQETVHR